MTEKKILYGVCGIGNGHTFRQLPIVQHFADEGHKIVIFAYDASYDFFTKHFADQTNVSVERVAVPYYIGNKEGLDFETAASLDINKRDFTVLNLQAMANAQRIIGKPDLVISDYEPVSAQYAYYANAPLATIDQQSKYLIGNFPETLQGQGFQDEVMRLRMFFPKAEQRIACSFFRVPPSRATANEKVEIVPPVLRKEIKNLERHPNTGKPSLAIYLTAQQWLEQPLDDMIKTLESANLAEYHIFLPKHVEILPKDRENMHFYHHGDERFESVLSTCNGIVTTAGHSLLSEAVYLGIPVYAMPLHLYEQQMNAKVIADNNFGVMESCLTPEKLHTFVNNILHFAENIAKDTTILLKNSGQEKIIDTLERDFLKAPLSYDKSAHKLHL